MVREISSGGVVIRREEGVWWMAAIEPAAPRRANRSQLKKRTVRTQDKYPLPAKGPGRSRRKSSRSGSARGARRNRDHGKSDRQARRHQVRLRPHLGRWRARVQDRQLLTSCSTSPAPSTKSAKRCGLRSPAPPGCAWMKPRNSWHIAARNSGPPGGRICKGAS